MIFLILLLVLVWVLPAEGNRICYQREQSQLLKFIASIVVVIGHQACYYDINNDLFMKETSLGALCVSFFLFMSGYGLLFGVLKKRQTLSVEWLSKRMLKLIVPALTSTFLLVVAKLIVGRKVDWENLFVFWFVSDDNLRYGWYVSEILVLYIAFFAVFKYLSIKNAIWMLSVSIGMAVVAMTLIKSPVWYIVGLPCFVMGLLLAYYDVTNIKVSMGLTGRQIKGFLSFVVLFLAVFKNLGVVQQYVPFFNKWRYMYFSFFACNIIFIVIVSYILMRLPKCRVMDKRGGYFYEIYLVQGATLLISRYFLSNDILFVVLGLFFTIFVAKVMSVVNGIIVRKL